MAIGLALERFAESAASHALLPKDALVEATGAAPAAEVASEAYNELAQITPIKPENLDAIATKRGFGYMLKVAKAS